MQLFRLKTEADLKKNPFYSIFKYKNSHLQRKN